ncbi:hexokinase-2-like [Uloborus diversus]|uniref:hexokinase-2-like n=1 Tax=Uloborus diversus TaxID=327109 RepID=UPI002409792A|nr:hexokinase-2-like [Uloborus diversus]
MASELEQMDAILDKFVLDDDTLFKVSSLLLQQMERGLSAEHNSIATVKMFPTYVTSFPNGKETGRFLALDLGGSNFRVLTIEMQTDVKIAGNIYSIPEEIMKGPGNKLFDFIVNCLEKLLLDVDQIKDTLPLGFTFSFPCVQHSLTSATLVFWTKGFECSDVEGRDVVQLLNDAIQRSGKISVEVIAFVNDTTGTLTTCAYKDENCKVGLIVGTGCNACYVEDTKNIHTLQPGYEDREKMIVNTEWGAFGDDGCLDFLRTKFDKEIDKESCNKGKQVFEKMISGMYMGEIVRKVLVEFDEKGLIPQRLPNRVREQGSFKSKYVSHIEEDGEGLYPKTKSVLWKLGFIETPEEDCEILKRVCRRVSTRAAHLVSAAVATLLNKMQRPETTIGVDGSVYRYHPFFKQIMEEKIADLTDPRYKFKLMLSEDGSGRGAAFVAAAAVREKREKDRKL